MANKPSRNKKDYDYQDLDSVDPEIVINMYEELRKDYVFVRGSSKAQVFWSYIDPTWALGKGVIVRKEDAPKPKKKVVRKKKKRTYKQRYSKQDLAWQEGYTNKRTHESLHAFEARLPKRGQCKVCFEPSSYSWRGMCKLCWDYRRQWPIKQGVDYLATYFTFAERFRTGDIPKMLHVASGMDNAQLTYLLRSEDMVSHEQQEDGQYDHWITS